MPWCDGGVRRQPNRFVGAVGHVADRPTTGGNGSGSYVYDQLGRQLTVPSVDAPNPAGGNVALAYFHDDSAKSITQGNTVLSYGLDVSGRRGTQTTSVSGSVTSTVVNHSEKVGRRLSQHVKSGKISRWQATTAKVYRVKGGKTRREVAEQCMIDKLRKRGKRLENKVNQIGVRRKHLMSSTPKNWRGI